MFERFPRKTMAATSAAFLAAMGIGGAAIAQSGNSQPSQATSAKSVQVAERPGVESNAPENSAKDPDSVQYTAPGDPDAKQNAKLTASSSASKEKPGTEQNPASETPGSESAETPGSESAPGSDGPGGHADEPGNPNANHQFQGVE